MRKRNKLWSFALAGALAVSNMTAVVAMPATAIVAQAAETTIVVSGDWAAPLGNAQRKFFVPSGYNTDLTTTLNVDSTDTDLAAAGLNDNGTVYFVPTVTVGNYSYEGVAIPSTYTASTHVATVDISAATIVAWASIGDAGVTIQAYGAKASGGVDRNIIIGDPLELETYKYAADTITWDTTAAKTSILTTDETDGFTISSIVAKRNNNSITETLTENENAVIVKESAYEDYTKAIGEYKKALGVANDKWTAYQTAVANDDGTEAGSAAVTSAKNAYNTAHADVKTKLDACIVAKAANMVVTAGTAKVTVTAGSTPPAAGKYYLLVAETGANLVTTGYTGVVKEYPFTVVDPSSMVLSSKNQTSQSTIASMNVGEEEQITVKLSGVRSVEIPTRYVLLMPRHSQVRRSEPSASLVQILRM